MLGYAPLAYLPLAYTSFTVAEDETVYIAEAITEVVDPYVVTYIPTDPAIAIASTVDPFVTFYISTDPAIAIANVGQPSVIMSRRIFGPVVQSG